MEYKTTAIRGFKSDDADEGVVETLVAVTGLKDNVNDIIAPGAFQKSLNMRTPKGVWHHNITESVSRTEAVKELLPGDKELPKTLPNGQPWPAEAGALKVKTRFNLRTTRGRDAYEDVKFFGAEQEWSIGYNVPMGGATVDRKTGIRTIQHMDLYEYSPVLFGAMPNARTVSVKSAQVGWKQLCGVDDEEIKSLLDELESKSQEEFSEFYKEHADELETKSKKFVAADEVDDEEDSEEDPVYTGDDIDDEEDDEEYDEEDETKSFPIDFTSIEAVDNAIVALEALKTALIDAHVPESKTAPSFAPKRLKNLAATAGLDVADVAAEFDAAVQSGDLEAMEQSGEAVLDAVEAAGDDGDTEALHRVTSFIASAFQTVLANLPDEDTDDSVPDETKQPEGDDAPADDGGDTGAEGAEGGESGSEGSESKSGTVVIDTKSFLAAFED